MHYDLKKELIIATDASKYGIGAVILHKFEDGSIKPIVHMHRFQLPAEKNYSQIKKKRSSDHIRHYEVSQVHT